MTMAVMVVMVMVMVLLVVMFWIEMIMIIRILLYNIYKKQYVFLYILNYYDSISILYNIIYII